MTSLCTKYAHFIITQGVVGGVTMGLTMAPLMGAIGHYFNKKRGAAMGLAISGSSLGGIVFPVALGKLLYNPKLSFGWTIRICGFIILALLVPSVTVIRTRLPRRKGQFIIPSAFKEFAYVLPLFLYSLMMTLTFEQLCKPGHCILPDDVWSLHPLLFPAFLCCLTRHESLSCLLFGCHTKCGFILRSGHSWCPRWQMGTSKYSSCSGREHSCVNMLLHTRQE